MSRPRADTTHPEPHEVPMSRILLAAAKSRLSPELNNMGHGWGLPRLRNEILAGPTLALALVPGPVSLASVARLPQLARPYAALHVT